MREPAPTTPPVALTVAGSDSGGGAGVQADLQTMAAQGVYGTSVLTAATAQNTLGVDSTHVLPTEEVAAQYDAVLADFDVGAIKTGMLATAPIVDLVARRVAGTDASVVVDPVMVAASGDRLLDPDAEAAYEALVAEADLVTPNADEATVLAGVEPTDESSAREAGVTICDIGADAALITGGHVEGDPVTDVLVTADRTVTFEHPRIDTDTTHGSGCTLSSAIAARLASGEDLETAVDGATDFLARAVRYHYDVGGGPGAVDHLVDLRNRAAREPTAEAVHAVVESLVEADAGRLVPEVGTNVAGATPHAEVVGDVAAVEGRITRTTTGIHPNRGVRFGASSHVARFLLAAREFDADCRFALNCRFDDEVGAAIDELEWPVAAYDRNEQPADVASAEGSTTDWGTRQAFETAQGTPVAVVDHGAVGKEPMCRLLAQNAPALTERTLALLERVRGEVRP